MKKSLSTGEALVIIALLLFILLWVGGWITFMALVPCRGDVCHDGTAGFFLLAAIIAPPVWAGGTISYIVGRDE